MHNNHVIRTFALLSLLAWMWTPAVHADGVSDGDSAATPERAPSAKASLGIASMECRCSYTIAEPLGARFYSFESEPRIREVDPEGPAHGKLRSGDAIVGIDGMLITTYEAGKRFANLVVGEPVELTVRRRGSLVDVTIIPVESSGEEEEYATFEGLSETSYDDLLHVRLALEELAKAEVDLESVSGTQGDEGVEIRDRQPAGWLGMGLSFSGSLQRVSDRGGTRWTFFEPPEVTSVLADSPAERAGLRPEDVLTHIAGVRLDTKRGGRLFSRIEPGQNVEFTIEREGSSKSVVIVAEERPERVPTK
jgi:C-terminal processing protease CtpA/Prc